MTRYARRNPEAALPTWLTVLDGARYFTHEALSTAVAESGWRSRTALVAMAPETFLALAYSGYMPEKAANVDAALRTTGAFWDVPYLMVEEDGDHAQVTGHEGRHRARALQALGVREMPVRIHARWLRWQETPEDAPRWLIPEKGSRGRTPVAMPPILGAARQNGGHMGRKKKYVEDLIYPKDFVFRRADLSPRVIERAVALGADPFFLGVYVRALSAETLPVQLRGNAAKDYASGVHVVSSDPTKGSHRPSIREVEAYLAQAIADVRGL